MFYDNYVRLCNSIGKTPSAVALEIGIAKPTVSRWKSGSKPNHATVLKVADYFGVSVSDLLDEKEKTTVLADDGDESDLFNEIVSAVKKADHDTQMDIYEMIKIIMKREK